MRSGSVAVILGPLAALKGSRCTYAHTGLPWCTIRCVSFSNTATRLGTATTQPVHQGKQGSSAHAHAATPAHPRSQPIHQRRPSGVSCGLQTGYQLNRHSKSHHVRRCVLLMSRVFNLQNVRAAGSTELGSDERGCAQPHGDKQTRHAGRHGAAHTHCWYNASAQYVGRATEGGRLAIRAAKNSDSLFEHGVRAGAPKGHGLGAVRLQHPQRSSRFTPPRAGHTQGLDTPLPTANGSHVGGARARCGYGPLHRAWPGQPAHSAAAAGASSAANTNAKRSGDPLGMVAQPTARPPSASARLVAPGPGC